MIDNIISLIKKVSIFDNFYFKSVTKKLIRDKITFIDVGAAGDLISRWKKIESKIITVAFEPDKVAFKKLKNAKINNKRIYNIALSDSKGFKNFYICRDGEKSSFLKPNFELLKNYPNAKRFDIKKIIKFKVDKLDNIGNFKPDFIKLDTQGSELEILKGSKKNLRECIGLEVEVEFQKMYRNQKLFNDVFHFLQNNGFDFIDFSEKTYWKFKNTSNIGQNLIFANALFLKNNVSVKKYSYKKLRKYILISLLYNKLNLVENILNEINVSQKKEITGILFVFFIRAKIISVLKKFFNFIIKFLGVDLSNNNIN